MSEAPTHYYNVIFGRCLCGARADAAEVTFSVFVEEVTCPHCLALLKGKAETPEKH
jgi:hypothetical protein